MLLPRGRTDNSGISGLKFLMGPFGPTPRLVGRPSSEALSEGSDAFESFFFFFILFFNLIPYPWVFKGLGNLFCVGTTWVLLGRYWWCALLAGRF